MSFLDKMLGKEKAEKMRRRQAFIMDPDKARMKALFEREITERLMATNNDEAIVTLTKQFICNDNNLHEFGDAGGGSPMGDRFVERCRRCGFENRV